MKTRLVISLCCGTILYMLPSPSSAQKAPAYSSEEYCESVSQAVGGSYQIKASCIDSEVNALTRITGMRIEERIRTYCEQVGKAVGGSYQIYLSCVESEMEAARASAKPALPAAKKITPAPKVGDAVPIDGFAELLWGAGMDEIEEKFGDPLSRSPMGAGATMNVYSTRVLGHPTTMVFITHEDHGLIAGNYIVEPRIRSQCEEVFNEARDAITEEYGIEPLNDFEDHSSLELCDAILIGGAKRLSVWTHHPSETGAAISLNEGSGDVVIGYFGPHHSEWNEKVKAEERSRIF